MCGIAGIFDHLNHPKIDELRPMVTILGHRGPDAEGTFVNGPIAMGMRRLSIIDLTTGNQPISNQDNSVTVVCNGEIYNYVELRSQLEEKGYRFKTKTDTEVLIHLYSEYGVDMLNSLNGMFAFSIWDELNKTLFIARDRMGIKPLYYAKLKDRLLYASELKSILTQSYLDKSLDLNAVADYLRIGYIPQAESPYKLVRKLLPGHYLLMCHDKISIVKWWDLKREWKQSNKSKLQSGFDYKTKGIFDKSIEYRMRSDVPVASFLSGGLDSSLISVTASKMSPIQFQTYNVMFKDAIFDESPYAVAVSKHSQTDHHQVVASASDALNKLPLLLWHMDEPIADSAIIPNFLVSEFASKNVKVCLSGLGGDEFFGGYSRYVDKPMGSYRKFFSKFPLLTRFLVRVLNRSKPKYAMRLAPLTGENNKWRLYLNLIQQFDTSMIKKLGLKEFGCTESIIENLWNEYPGEDSVGRRQFIDQHTYLPDQILALTDRMSMAVSLEVRVPFLDHNLIMQAYQLSDIQKQSINGDFKIWLKSVLGYRVPENILNRKKWGFDAPVVNWVNSLTLQSIIKQLPEILAEIFNKDYIKILVQDKHNPRYHNMMWTLIVLAVWLKVRIYKEPPRMTINQLFQ